jgi:hypothetical protein
VIRLSDVRRILDGEVREILTELDGVDLDDTSAIASQTKTKAREARAEMSKSLLLLADRLDLCASLVRREYWFARGEIDPLNPDRED